MLRESDKRAYSNFIVVSPTTILKIVIFISLKHVVNKCMILLCYYIKSLILIDIDFLRAFKLIYIL